MKSVLVVIAWIVAGVLILRILGFIMDLLMGDPIFYGGGVKASFDYHRVRMILRTSDARKAAYIRRLMDRADQVSNESLRREMYVVCTDLVWGLGDPIHSEVWRRFDMLPSSR